MNTGETIALIKAFGKGGGGGSSLPAVTSADNGKVLGVVDGAWAADSNLFLVTLSGSPITSDKTYAEIVAAVDAGRTVIAEQGGILFQFAGYTTSAVEFVKFTASGSTVMKRAIKSNGSVDSYSNATVPTPNAADNGSELIVKNGAWAKQQKKFVVTLTPTSPDYSGTMDKTVAEINAAYEAGQEIWFKVLTNATSYVEVPVSFLGKNTSFDYPNFGAEIVQSYTNLMIVAETLDTSDGTKTTYYTTVYTLTPAS